MPRERGSSTMTGTLQTSIDKFLLRYPCSSHLFLLLHRYEKESWHLNSSKVRRNPSFQVRANLNSTCLTKLGKPRPPILPVPPNQYVLTPSGMNSPPHKKQPSRSCTASSYHPNPFFPPTQSLKTLSKYARRSQAHEDWSCSSCCLRTCHRTIRRSYPEEQVDPTKLAIGRVVWISHVGLYLC
jgi:hypothetical protein